MLETAIDTVLNTFGLCREQRLILPPFFKTVPSHATVSHRHRRIPTCRSNGTRCVNQVTTRCREPSSIATLPDAKQHPATIRRSIDAGRTLPMCKSPLRRYESINLRDSKAEQACPLVDHNALRVILSLNVVNQRMVAGGWAWHYEHYSSDQTLARLESQAKSGCISLSITSPRRQGRFRPRQ